MNNSIITPNDDNTIRCPHCETTVQLTLEESTELAQLAEQASTLASVTEDLGRSAADLERVRAEHARVSDELAMVRAQRAATETRIAELEKRSAEATAELFELAVEGARRDLEERARVRARRPDVERDADGRTRGGGEGSSLLAPHVAA